MTQKDGLSVLSIDETKTNGTGVGGIFGFESASLYGVQARIGAYVSQKVYVLTPDQMDKRNNELFGANGESYVYVGEASLSYENSYFKSQIGRIRVETPYADSDDIRMSPNSFEGASAHLDFAEDWHANALFLSCWAGVDSGDDPSAFKPLVEDGYGLIAISLEYDFNADNSFALWYYHVDKESDILYAEASGEWTYSATFHMEWGVQGAYIEERSDSGVGGEVLGGMFIADFDLLYFGAAYNYVFEHGGNTITDGFGGGPYYTSLDEQTIGAVSALSPGEDLRVYRLVLGVDMTSIGVKGLNFELFHAHFNLESSDPEALENDVIMTYQITDRWYFETIFADVDLKGIDYSQPDNAHLRNFKRLVTRLDYSF